MDHDDAWYSNVVSVRIVVRFIAVAADVGRLTVRPKTEKKFDR